MPDAAFKDLVIDATDAPLLAAFWSGALGLRSRPLDDSAADALLEGDTPEQAVWINRVPEPRTVKQRVHLDVHAPLDELLALGATVDTVHDGWTVLRDPEGGEFCALPDPGADGGRYRAAELVVDSADPEAACAWWADRFGLAVQQDAAVPWSWLERGAGLPVRMSFNPVPEPKTVKNRVHWDVWGETGSFLEAGATLVTGREDSPDPRVFWDVLADPEGNEFCVFRPE